MEYLRKKICMLFVAISALSLSACGMRAETVEQIPGEPELETPASTEENQKEDWRETAKISTRAAMMYGGESVKVCICVEDEKALIYRDEPVQELLAQADYPEALENGTGNLSTCEFEDLDQDGNSELTLTFDRPDGGQAVFQWLWIDGEGYVLNEEFPQITDKAVSELTALLDEIYTDVQPGSAGSSLKATIAAAHLMNWGVETTMTADKIRTETVNWLSDKGNEEQEIFSESLTGVYYAYQELLQPGAEELLETAGCEDANYPWTDSPDTPIEAIEVIVDAAQLPENE